jgi:hypothetical protein
MNSLLDLPSTTLATLEEDILIIPWYGPFYIGLAYLGWLIAG